jgi:hypothetical protein
MYVESKIRIHMNFNSYWFTTELYIQKIMTFSSFFFKIKLNYTEVPFMKGCELHKVEADKTCV